MQDPATGRTFYVNEETRESSWTKPAEDGWTVVA
jgi:hypothetical protein